MEQIEKFAEEVRKELRLLVLGGYASNGALIGVCLVNAYSASSFLSRAVGARFRDLEKEFGVEVKEVRYVKDTDECFYTVKHGDVKAEVKVA